MTTTAANFYELEEQAKRRNIKYVNNLDSETKWELVNRNLIVFVSMNQPQCIRKLITHNMETTLFIISDSHQDTKCKFEDIARRLFKADIDIKVMRQKLHIRINHD